MYADEIFKNRGEGIKVSGGVLMGSSSSSGERGPVSRAHCPRDENIVRAVCEEFIESRNPTTRRHCRGLATMLHS